MSAKTKTKRSTKTIQPNKEKKNEKNIQVSPPEETAIEVQNIITCNEPILRVGTEGFKNSHFGIREGVEIYYSKRGCESAKLTAKFVSKNSEGKLWEVSGTIGEREIETKTLSGLVEMELYCYSQFLNIPWEGKKETRKKVKGSFLGLNFYYPFEIEKETKYIHGSVLWGYVSKNKTLEQLHSLAKTPEQIKRKRIADEEMEEYRSIFFNE